MSIKHFAPFAFTTSIPFSASFDFPGEPLDGGEIRISGSWFHCLSASIERKSYGNFVQRFDTEINALYTQTPLVVSYDAQNRKYHILGVDGNFSLRFGNITSARVMGFGEANVAYSSSEIGSTGQYLLSSSVGAWYQWNSSLKEKARWNDIEEQPGRLTDQVADDGTTYGFGHDGSEIHENFIHVREPKAKTHTQFVNASDTYSWQRHIWHVANMLPIIIVSGTHGNVSGSDVTRVHKYRGDSANFGLERWQTNWDPYWNINVGLRVVLSASVSGSNGLFPGPNGLGA